MTIWIACSANQTQRYSGCSEVGMGKSHMSWMISDCQHNPKKSLKRGWRRGGPNPCSLDSQPIEQRDIKARVRVILSNMNIPNQESWI